MSFILRDLFGTNAQAAGVRSLTTAIQQRDPLVASAIIRLESSIAEINNWRRSLSNTYVPYAESLAADGSPTARIGAWGNFRGGAFESLAVGPGAIADPANAEVYADASGVTIQGAVLNIKQLNIPDLVLTNNSPIAGSIAWTACTPRFGGTSYSVASGNTALAFVYWNIGDATFTASAAYTPQVGRLLIVVNVGGVADESWNKVGAKMDGTSLRYKLNGITTTLDNSLLGGNYTGLTVVEDATGDTAMIFQGTFAGVPAGGDPAIAGFALFTSAVDYSGKFLLRDGSESGGQDGFGRTALIDGEIGRAYFSGGLGDANGNISLTFTPTASAVNYFYLVNAATGGIPSLGATGSDANVHLGLAPKGTGTVLVANSVPFAGVNNAGSAVVSMMRLNTSDNTEMVNGLVVPTGKTARVTGADALIVGGVIVPQCFYITFRIPAGALLTDYDGVQILPDAAQIVSVIERHAVAGTDGSPVTLMVKKVTEGVALAFGTDCLSTGINLKGAADVNQVGSLHTTQANYQFGAGNSVGLVVTGTPTSVDSVAVTVKFKRI